MTEQKLNKWQKELGRLENSAYIETKSDLGKAYQASLQTLLDDLQRWADDYETMTPSQQREFDRRMSVAEAVADVTDELSADVSAVVTDYVRGSGERGYQGTMYALESDNKINLANTLIDPNYLEQLVIQPVGAGRFSKTMYERLNIDRDKLAKRVQQSIMDGLWRGDGYDKVAGRIRELTGASFNAALRIARTEAGRVQSQTTQLAYKDADNQGIELTKRWLATLDGHTRADHRVLDGQTVGLDEKFHVSGFEATAPHMFGIASEDINCRCTTIPIVGDIEPSLRRDNETGEEIEYTDYNSWLKSKYKDDDSTFDILDFSDLISDKQGEILGRITPDMVSSMVNDVLNTEFSGEETTWNNSYQQALYNAAQTAGYDQLPTIISRNDIDDDRNVFTRFWRGGTAEFNKERAEQFINGELMYSGSRGSLKGRGVYFGSGNNANNYNDNDGAVKMQIALSKDTVILDYLQFAERVRLLATNSGYRINPLGGRSLIDRLAIELGVDGWYVESDGYLVMVNRGKVGVIND